MSDRPTDLAALWLVPSYPWDGDSISGVFIQTQARAISRHGVAVSIVAPSPWSPWPARIMRQRWKRYAAVPRSSRDGPVRINRPRFVGMPTRPDLFWPDRQIEMLAQRTMGHDVVSVVHGHFAMPHGVAAVRMGSKLHRPVVVTLHGSDVNQWPTTRRRGLHELRAAVHGADVIIAVSAALAARTEDLTGRRPVVLPVGIDLNAMRVGAMSAAEARRRVGWPLSAPIVTFVGSITEGKGVRDLVAAADLLPSDVLVMLIGDGPLERELAATGPVRDGRARLCGAVRHDDIPMYLAASSVMVLPSFAEGLPTVLLEAGAMGVPVVATSVGGIPDLLGGGGGWLVEPGRPDALAAAIADVLLDPDEAFSRADNLQRTVVDNHDAAIQAARLIGVYRGLGM